MLSDLPLTLVMCAVYFRLGGKSLLWMLPSLLEQTRSCRITTLLVIPLLALRADIEARLQRHGIQYVRFSPAIETKMLDTVYPFPYVVVAGVEDLGDALLRHVLLNHSFIRRLILDEAHLWITSSSYRPAMQRVVGLAKSGLGMLLLSATMTSEMWSHLKAAFQLQHVTCTVLRTPSTARLNVKYSVQHVVDDSAAQILTAQLISAQAAISSGGGMCIVFCLTKRVSNSIAEYLRTALPPATMIFSYHSDRSAEDRHGISKAVRSQTSLQPIVVVATMGFGTGIDLPNVDLVINIGGATSLLEYNQESGRSGRDGRRADAVWIECPHSSRVRDYVLPPAQRMPWESYSMLQNYALPDHHSDVCCRRVSLARSVDDEQCKSCQAWQDSQLPGTAVQLCDVCELALSRLLEAHGSYAYSLRCSFLESNHHLLLEFQNSPCSR
jgi:ATP-dependent DNA helicase RecQ